MSAEHSHRLSTSSASYISSTMSIDDIQFLSSSSATSFTTTMSIDDIQILSTSPALSNSTSSNTNGSSSSSNTSSGGSIQIISSSFSSNSLSYSSERICYLLKHEKHKYDIVDNKASLAVASYWSVFGFPGKLNKETGNFERIMGFTSCQFRVMEFNRFEKSEISHGLVWPAGPVQAKKPDSLPFSDRQAESELLNRGHQIWLIL